jgi:hypothetical protein
VSISGFCLFLEIGGKHEKLLYPKFRFPAENTKSYQISATLVSKISKIVKEKHSPEEFQQISPARAFFKKKTVN